METRNELREFLATRRAKLTPERAGLPTYGRSRRVTGLRREEVALLAGVSIGYYTRLERGQARGVSDQVLDALSRALQLGEAERAHLFDLTRTANAGIPVTAGRGSRVRRGAPRHRVRPGVQQLLDAMTGSPAILQNGCLDILAANPLGRALYADMFSARTAVGNHARYVFLEPRSQAFYADWERAAANTVATLRAGARRAPRDRALSDLVGELSTRSTTFSALWATHNVRRPAAGIGTYHHPVVGDLTLACEALDLCADPGLTLLAHTAEPGSPSQDALQLLASWTAPAPPPNRRGHG